MKKLLIVICFTLISLPVWAQVVRVDIDIFGNYEITAQVGNGQYVTVDQFGQVSYIDIEGRWLFYDNFWAYQAGKVKQVGDVRFSYYDDFWAYKAGKIKKIGSVDFSFNDDFWAYKAGKLDKVGGVKINYYDDFWDYHAGKVKNIGNINIEYYSGTGIGSDMYKGLLKSINGSEYGYSRVTVRQPVRLNNGPMSLREDVNYSGNGLRSGAERSSQENKMHGQASPGAPVHRPNAPGRPTSYWKLQGRRLFEVGNVLVVVHDVY